MSDVRGGSRRAGPPRSAPSRTASRGAPRVRAEEVERAARALDDGRRALIATDISGTILVWSERAEALYGWSAAEVLGRDILQVTPTELSREEGARTMALLARGRTWSGRFVVRDRAGRRFTVEVTDIPVRDSAGELVGIVGLSERVEFAAS